MLRSRGSTIAIAPAALLSHSTASESSRQHCLMSASLRVRQPSARLRAGAARPRAAPRGALAVFVVNVVRPLSDDGGPHVAAMAALVDQSKFDVMLNQPVFGWPRLALGVARVPIINAVQCAPPFHYAFRRSCRCVVSDRWSLFSFQPGTRPAWVSVPASIRTGEPPVGSG